VVVVHNANQTVGVAIVYHVRVTRVIQLAHAFTRWLQKPVLLMVSVMSASILKTLLISVSGVTLLRTSMAGVTNQLVVHVQVILENVVVEFVTMMEQ